MFDVIVIGGGAAGLTAAIAAGRAGARVLVLEKRDRIGTKILASGNGRCNLTNTSINAQSFYSTEATLLPQFAYQFSLSSTLRYWHELGLELVEEEGRVYPRTMQAKSVLETLQQELTHVNAVIVPNSPVTAVSHSAEVFDVACHNGTIYQGRTVVLAVGGKAAPQLGCAGDGYAWAERFGHTVRAPAPALVGLRLASAYLKPLAGLRVEATVSLSDVNHSETGEVQFTPYGVSGIPVFDLSARIGHSLPSHLHLRLSYHESSDDLQSFLHDRVSRFAGKTLRQMLQGFLPEPMIGPLMHTIGMAGDVTCARLKGPAMINLENILWDWPFPLVGLNTWEQAQTTWGGIPLSEIDVASLASKKQPGLYLAGEILDIHGRCGGYNLHWAFASGTLAGESAAAFSRSGNARQH